MQKARVPQRQQCGLFSKMSPIKIYFNFLFFIFYFLLLPIKLFGEIEGPHLHPIIFPHFSSAQAIPWTTCLVTFLENEKALGGSRILAFLCFVG